MELGELGELGELRNWGNSEGGNLPRFNRRGAGHQSFVRSFVRRLWRNSLFWIYFPELPLARLWLAYLTQKLEILLVCCLA